MNEPGSLYRHYSHVPRDHAVFYDFLGRGRDFVTICWKSVLAISVMGALLLYVEKRYNPTFEVV